MVTISFDDNNMKLMMQGIGRILALKSELTIPLTHVRGVTADPGVASMSKGIRGPGTRIPGIVAAGTFHRNGEKVFWDVYNPLHAIVIELKDEEFQRLVVEVKDPEAAVALIEQHISLDGSKSLS